MTYTVHPNGSFLSGDYPRASTEAALWSSSAHRNWTGSDAFLLEPQQQHGSRRLREERAEFFTADLHVRAQAMMLMHISGLELLL